MPQTKPGTIECSGGLATIGAWYSILPVVAADEMYSSIPAGVSAAASWRETQGEDLRLQINLKQTRISTRESARR
jgi:hypothetical protein